MAIERFVLSQHSSGQRPRHLQGMTANGATCMKGEMGPVHVLLHAMGKPQSPHVYI